MSETEECVYVAGGLCVQTISEIRRYAKPKHRLIAPPKCEVFESEDEAVQYAVAELRRLRDWHEEQRQEAIDAIVELLERYPAVDHSGAS